MINNCKIRFLVIDVDGTLTDGKIYMSESGELFKAFDIKDGYGIKEILPQYNIVPIIITARQGKILEKRCRELGIEELHQGIQQKGEKLVQIIADFQKCDMATVDLSQVAYIGDDIFDIQCMKMIKGVGGLVGCPKDAVQEVIAIADYVCAKQGGAGAVREFIEYLKKNI